MFIGRSAELARLNAMYESGSFEFAVVYGRRRVGKTTLINEFCRDKRTVFFTALESTPEANRESLSRSLGLASGAGLAAPVYRSFDDIFERAAALAENERLILVIDEYPWLAESDGGVSSILQRFIDHRFKGTKLFLVLCGSSMSFMENQVLGHRSPLFGRRTAQFRVVPFDYRETAMFHPSMTPEENAVVYGVTGGVPLYVEQFHEGAGMELNIKENFLNANSLLFEEPSNLLKQELREPKTYNAILSAIAGGASRLSEIANRVGCESGPCAKYLASLAELGIVEKLSPVTEPNSRRTIYRVSDQLFRFWHRFVPDNMASIASGRADEAWRLGVEPYLPDYMGGVFERMALEYLLRYAGDLPLDVGRAGRWWGTDPERREQTDIDAVILSRDGRKALFAECKYRNEKTGADALKDLTRRAALISGPSERSYALFSKSGFTSGAVRGAKELGAMTAALRDMYP